MVQGGVDYRKEVSTLRVYRGYICERCVKIYDSEATDYLENRCIKGGKLISVRLERVPKDIITMEVLESMGYDLSTQLS